MSVKPKDSNESASNAGRGNFIPPVVVLIMVPPAPTIKPYSGNPGRDPA